MDKHKHLTPIFNVIAEAKKHFEEKNDHRTGPKVLSFLRHLDREGVEYLGQIAACPSEYPLGTDGFGPKSLEALQNFLRTKYGESFKLGSQPEHANELGWKKPTSNITGLSNVHGGWFFEKLDRGEFQAAAIVKRVFGITP
ncbi:MAG: hypothetical protein AAF988_06140 [Pseudomonadota bacterium]